MSNLKYKLVALTGCDVCCAYCGKFTDLSDLVADHVTPKCQGGSNDISNLLLSCNKCNNSKGGKNLNQYRATKSIESRGLRGVVNINQLDVFDSLGIDLGLKTYLFHFEKVRPND
jgi:hypothetical protein